MLSTVFQKRFTELEAQFAAMPFRLDAGGTRVPSRIWQQWATSAQNLILAVFGKESPHYTNFVVAFKEGSGYDHSVHVLKGILLSAKADFEGGYVFDVDLRVSGEVVGDFVAMAKHHPITVHNRRIYPISRTRWASSSCADSPGD